MPGEEVAGGVGGPQPAGEDGTHASAALGVGEGQTARPEPDLLVDRVLKSALARVRGYAGELNGIAGGLRSILERAERPDRLGIGSGYGSIEPDDIAGVIRQLDDLSHGMELTAEWALLDVGEGEVDYP
jgi:hypothetical protein